MLCTAAFNGPVTLPVSQHTEFYDEEDSILPKDGLPRITREGLDILLEGLQGNFSRWMWGIGNHPLHIPYKHTRNLFIDAMKDEPHFLAKFWFGGNYPQVNYRVMTPYYSFDVVDTNTLRDDEINCIHLRQSTDHWVHVPVQIDDSNLWTLKDKNRFKEDSPFNYDTEEEEENEEEEETTVAPSQTKLEVFF